MALSDDTSIERLAHRVIDRTLPKGEWTHEGHFAAALWLSRHRPTLTTPGEIRELITRYNEATNTANTDTGGYHHTITLASLRAAASHLRGQAPDAPLYAVLVSLMGSPFGDPDWLLAYWRSDTLFSVTARREWVESDIVALPF